jgi:uncharacterized membrane protein YfcA
MRILLTLALGLVTGVLSGMFGIGGAVVSTPGIRALGVEPLQAVGSTLPAMLPSAISGSLRYHREGLLVPRIIAWVAIVGTGAAIGASFLSHAVPGDGHWLMVATAGIIVYTAVRVGAIGSPDAPVLELAPAAWRDDGWRLAVCGVAAGGLSGLLGLGGGTILVPAFLTWIRLPVKTTIANSLAAVGLLAIPSTIAHAALGDIDWAVALTLAIAVVPGARIGANLAIRTSDRALRLSLASTLGVIAVVYAVRELTFVV